MNKFRSRKLVILFAVISVFWIIGSDWVLIQLFGDFPDTVEISMIKGIAFVLLMSVILYVLLLRLDSAESIASAASSNEQLLLYKTPSYFKQIPIITYAIEIQDHKSKTLWVSDNIKHVLGYSPTEVLSLNWWAKHVHPDDQLRALEENKEIQNRGSGDHYYRIRHANGNYLHIHDELTLLPNTSPPRFIGVLQDISGEERALEQVNEYSKRLEKTVLGTVNAISQMVELRDPYTAGHEYRVGELAADIAKELGLDVDTQYGLRIAGLVHDIGKISIPSEYLTKPTTLSDLEFDIIKTHPEKGYQILKNIEFSWPVAEIAYQHHERMDGSGYPRGLKGDEILLEARIIAVADVIESMATNRPYRHALGLELALEEIQSKKAKLYDKDVVDATLRLFLEKDYQLPQRI